jgi:hypothetical protein
LVDPATSQVVEEVVDYLRSHWPGIGPGAQVARRASLFCYCIFTLSQLG